MENQIYNYSSSYGGAGVSSSSYSARLNTATDRYSDASRVGSSRYLSLDPSSGKFSPFERGPSSYSNPNDGLRYSSAEIPGIGAAGSYPTSKIGASGASWAGVDGFGTAPSMDSALVPGMKRSAEALYHQTILGTHNTIGQSEALFSANSLEKRPRFEIASNLPIYPERPGERDCAHYMLTRTCKFGINCKFDHPRWVPEGGIPDWKEIPLIHTTESLPERPGEPDCPFYLKTQRCKFGTRCKFNHPKGITDASAGVIAEEVHIPSSGQGVGSAEQNELTVKDNGAAGGDIMPTNPFVPFTPALMHNSKGLPIRPGEPDCPFYLKTGSCKYGATCRYNHPERTAINPSVAAALGQAFVASPVTNLPVGVFNQATTFLPNIDPRLTQTTIGVGPVIYPQRPGQLECDFYMKTGQCKFGERCRFHHPIDRSVPTSEQNVKLTLAGLPRREGTVACPYYMKTGACKYGVKCRFDHPPPGEAIAMATVQGLGIGIEIEATAGEEENGSAAAAAEEQE